MGVAVRLLRRSQKWCPVKYIIISQRFFTVATRYVSFLLFATKKKEIRNKRGTFFLFGWLEMKQKIIIIDHRGILILSCAVRYVVWEIVVKSKWNKQSVISSVQLKEKWVFMCYWRLGQLEYCPQSDNLIET